ncbi:MAG: transposase [Candidatus Saccharimonadales bacterium]
MENVWSHIKRGIKGVYRKVSRSYLQLYANEYAWRYNNRSQKVLFWDLLVDATSSQSFSLAEQRAFFSQPF